MAAEVEELESGRHGRLAGSRGGLEVRNTLSGALSSVGTCSPARTLVGSVWIEEATGSELVKLSDLAR